MWGAEDANDDEEEVHPARDTHAHVARAQALPRQVTSRVECVMEI